MPPLLPDSKILEEAGRILAVWGYIEFQTKVLLQHLLDIDFKKTELIYGSFVSFDSKLKLCGRLNIQINSLPEVQDSVKSILEKLKPFSDKRNTIAHSLYGVDSSSWAQCFIVNYLPTNEDRPHHGENREITAESMIDLRKEFEEVSSKFDELLNQIRVDK